ncbi:MAG: pyridoxamine 5'-phosphate oxidase family protein [Pseudomonadota bacterium]
MNQIIDIAFSNTVKAIQARKGSRDVYVNMAQRGNWSNEINDELRAFIGQQQSIYLGTVGSNGQPYIQHRGGPPGFLQVLDNRTIAFADFKGNRQYISQGNLQDNPKAFLFLMDYSIPRRLKIWGEARVIEDDKALIQQLMPAGYRAKPEQVILFTVNLWDFNCRQHISLRFDKANVNQAIETRDRRIQELEATIAQLKKQRAHER